MKPSGLRTMPLSHAAPLLLDCLSTSGVVALRRVQMTVRALSQGGRTLIVRTDEPEVLDAVTRWARIGGARHDVVESEYWTELRLYLLPRDFGERPFLAWSAPLPVLVTDEQVTAEPTGSYAA